MRILMISNHLGVQSGVQRYVQNLLLNLDTAKYHIDLFVGQCPADQASTAPALEAHGVHIIAVPDNKKDRIRALAAHLRTHKEYLPTGERLTDHRFQMAGHFLGGRWRERGLHYFLETAFAEGNDHLSDQFLTAMGSEVTFQANPLYALMHETIYADGPADGVLPGIPGYELSPSPAPTNWSAARVAASRPEFAPDADRLLFTGDTVYPGPLYAHLSGEHGAEVYRRTLEKLAPEFGSYTLLCSHNSPVMEGAALAEMAEAFSAVERGDVSGYEYMRHRRYDFDGFSIVM